MNEASSKPRHIAPGGHAPRPRRRGDRPLPTARASCASVFVRTLYYTFRGQARERAPSSRRCTRSATSRLFFLSITMGFIGMILVYQAGLQSKRVVPDFTMLGATYLELLVRDFAASIGALDAGHAGRRGHRGRDRLDGRHRADRRAAHVRRRPDRLPDRPALPREPGHDAGARSSGQATSPSLAGAVTAHVALRRPVLRTSSTCASSTWGDVVDRAREVHRLRRGDPGRQRLSAACRPSAAREGVGWATTRAVVNSSLVVIILNAIISSAAFLIFPN